MFFYPSWHPAFDMDLQFDQAGEVQRYGRQLNLETGEALSRWSDENNQVEQRVFSSQAHNVNIIEVRATENQKLNLALRLMERPGRIVKKEEKYRNMDINGAFNSITMDSVPGWLTYLADYALDSEWL